MKILFQGDSITDAGRARDNDINIGRGYAHFVKANFNYTRPLQHEFINRGVSGNKITDVYTRIRCDIINQKPDFMSMLVGINDIWQEYDFGGKNGVSAKKYETIYNMMIEEIKEELPDVKILIMAPFVLDASATAGCLADGRNKYEVFREEAEMRAEASKRVAERYSLGFLPLQCEFDKASAIGGASYWTSDGVHPTEAGHSLIADLWIKKFDEMTQ